jgi:uncharacterized protein YacL
MYKNLFSGAAYITLFTGICFTIFYTNPVATLAFPYASNTIETIITTLLHYSYFKVHKNKLSSL